MVEGSLASQSARLLVSADGHLLPSANVDLVQLDDRLADMERRAATLAPAFRELRRPFVGDQRVHARDEEGPSGGWPPRAAATEERRRMRNKRIRQPKAMRLISPRPSKRRSTPTKLLGRLPRALLVTVASDFIRATSRAPWSYAHMKGAKVGHNRSVRLPQRQFLWLSDRLLVTANEIFARHIVKGWQQ